MDGSSQRFVADYQIVCPYYSSLSCGPPYDPFYSQKASVQSVCLDSAIPKGLTTSPLMQVSMCTHRCASSIFSFSPPSVQIFPALSNLLMPCMYSTDLNAQPVLGRHDTPYTAGLSAYRDRSSRSRCWHAARNGYSCWLPLRVDERRVQQEFRRTPSSYHDSRPDSAM